jgi:MFS family permease
MVHFKGNMQIPKIRGIPYLIIIVAILAFFSDLCNSSTSPTVSLRALDLGATKSFIGTMLALASLVRLIVVQPVGFLCDRKNPRFFIIFGFFLYIINYLFLIFATNPYHILLGQIFSGVGTAMFYTASVTSILQNSEGRTALSIGIYATMMGLGFSLGPTIGGILAEKYSYTISYVFSITAASIAIIIGLLSTRFNKRIQVTPPKQELKNFSYRNLLANKNLLVVSLGAFFTSEALGNSTGFFPIFGKSLTLTEGSIGIILGIRALSSTIVRIPTGKAAEIFGARRLMLVAMFLSAVGLFLVPQFRIVWLIPIFLSLEGIGYGMFLTSANAYIGEITNEGQKGAAVGVYNTFSAVGSVLNMTILGIIADTFGVENTFRFTSIMITVGIALLLIISWEEQKHKTH